MSFYCPECGREIPDSSADMEAMSAKCFSCGSTISFAEGVDEAERRALGIDKRVRMPDSMIVTESAEELRIVKPWFTEKWIPVLALCCIWDFGVCLAWHEVLTSSVPLSHLSIPVIQSAIGLVATIVVVQFCVNRTHIVANASGLAAYSGPITLDRPKHIAIDEIDQIYCRAEWPESKCGRFEVIAVSTDGKCVSIARGLTEIEHARFIERRLETRMGIPDRWIPGEFL